MWNNSELLSKGECRQTIRNPKNGKKYSVNIVIYDGDFMPLLGYSASKQMELITVDDKNFDRIAAVSLENKYSDLFDGQLGQLGTPHHLKVNENMHPVVMPSRRIPIAVRPKLKAELSKMQKLGVITPVDEPTPWVSQLVMTLKRSGALRVCVDPRELNKALLCEHYTLPILDETLHEKRDSRVFSLADLSSGYWHISLDKESSLLTTFQTPFGRYRWCRLPFGTSVSAEIFQKKLLDSIEGLPGVTFIADDVLIHGKTVEDHDRCLELFLKRCQETEIKLNKSKLQLRLDKIVFMGHLISKDGLKSDPDKVKAITNMKPPTSLQELRRYLGMVNYLAKFLPNLSDILQPLHMLTKRDVTWTWSESQESAFQSVKQLITNTPVLAYYDPNKELVLENDASEYGLGSALFQCGKPIAFASRSLTDTERHYAQIEKEMLAVTFGLEKFHHYTYGRETIVITDHKPLESMVLKSLCKAPKRLQSLLLRANQYNFSLVYRPGKSIPVADTLSRSPLQETSHSEQVFTVNNVSLLNIKDHRLNDIRCATQLDRTMSDLKALIMDGWHNHRSDLPQSVTPYFTYQDELTVQYGIVLRGERVVIPTSMRSEIIQPKIGTDLFSINEKNYLITVDYYSHFFEVDYLPDLSATIVITKLKHHFARHGIPDVVVSDCGTQYTSANFKKFSDEWRFKHEMASPGNSKANGAAEATVKIAKNMMIKSAKAKEDPYIGLLNIRNTPTEGLQTSPAQMLFGRRTLTLIPTDPNRLVSTGYSRSIDNDRRDRMRAIKADHLNSQRRDLIPLGVGDVVRMQPIQCWEKEWREATVTERVKNQSYIVEAKSGRTYRRNRQFLRHRNAVSTLVAVHSDPNVMSQAEPLPTSPLRGKEAVSPAVATTPQRSPETTTHMDGPDVYKTRSGRIVKPVQRLDT